ncbi:hypothetical protein NLG97_g5703 [Lecanicillium saksenae]|uniref:Uncharacterized protein n=1 Tax=Lecanicillium saksenae TaxID=468837 RepID=A0ACC1QRP2_9HYPO|nr:hypothetical protein NLG97_g5703 [Lecanicillium saksenae]
MNEPGDNVGATAPGGAHAATWDTEDDDSFINEALNMATENDRIRTYAPEEPFRLSFIDVTCLLVNRTIGTGIFNGPKEVMKGARTPGVAMLMWFCGCIYCLSGSHVFLEYGLNVPRYVIDGVEQSVPRSGGELHYLQYVFSRPRYKEDTIVLISVMFGLGFICVGNMASNCIDCAVKLLILANNDSPSQALIRGIAIVIATITCFIHAFSRRGGILLNNLLAVVKFLFLVSIVIATWVVAGSVYGVHGIPKPSDHNPAVEKPDDELNSNAEAFLFIVFAFFGFDQPSYVLGEIKHPRKNFPKAMWWGMGLVSVMYLAVNICYMLVVPTDVQMKQNVAQEFFARVFNSNDRAEQTVNAFLIISSFGNVVVWTFTAARMKQEIAKQCYLPFSKFFAIDKDVSLGRFLLWLASFRSESSNRNSRRIAFLNPANHREKTPVGAFTLHLSSCIVLICATWGMDADDAYSTLSSLFSYLLAAWFGAFLATGILILHIWGPPATQPIRTPNHRGPAGQAAVRKSWKDITKGSVNPKMSIICAVLYLIGSLYPIIARWVPPPSKKGAEKRRVVWYAVPLAAMCIMVFSTLWFLGFLAIAKYKRWRYKLEFSRVSKPEFDWAERRDAPATEEHGHESDVASVRRLGGLILTHETIYPAWTRYRDEEPPLPVTQNLPIRRRPVGGPNPVQRGWHESWQMNATESRGNDFVNEGPPEAAYWDHNWEQTGRSERLGPATHSSNA